MAYIAKLSSFQQLAIANVNGQTQINLTLSRSGQQQSQSSSFSTGQWQTEPELFCQGQDYVLKITSEQGVHYIVIQQNSISTVAPPADLNNYSTINFEEIPNSTPESGGFKPMQPMQPMQPMKIGDMSMDIESMSMQMGNMSLNLDNQAQTTTKTFCSQCGTEAKSGDRFCRSCGHKLD